MIPRSALCVLVLATGAQAAPAPTWADWVGDYAGPLTWKGCFTPGAARATISLDAIDGAFVIELVNAGGGLRAMSLVEEEGGWSAQQGDVTLRVQRPRANALVLDAEVGSDCRMQGHLVRPSTKIAACDRLTALTRIEARCTKLTAPPLEDPGKLAKERARWRPRAKADAQRCELRAAALESSLVDAGCARDPMPPSMVRAPDCATFLASARRFQQCALALPVVKSRVLTQAAALLATCGTADDAALRVLGEQCRAAQAELATVATHSRCPL